MKRIIAVLLFLSVTSACLAQDAVSQATMSYKRAGTEKILVLREAKEYKKSSVGVVVYLTGDILEVAVDARMYGQRPKIHGVLIIGPELGRLSYLTREIILAKLTDTAEADTYDITDVESHIVFKERTETKKMKGAPRKELFKFRIPRDKILPDKEYQLKVDIEGTKPGSVIRERFRFDLKDFAQLLSSANQSK